MTKKSAHFDKSKWTIRQVYREVSRHSKSLEFCYAFGKRFSRPYHTILTALLQLPLTSWFLESAVITSPKCNLGPRGGMRTRLLDESVDMQPPPRRTGRSCDSALRKHGWHRNAEAWRFVGVCTHVCLAKAWDKCVLCTRTNQRLRYAVESTNA